MKGIVITPDMDIRVEDFGEPLHETVGAVVGSHIEHSLPKGLPDPYCMIVNGKGRLEGLPKNPVGCELYGTPEHGQPIVGTVVLLKDGIVKGEPDIVGLDDEDIDQLMEIVAPIAAGKQTEEDAGTISFTVSQSDCSMSIHARVKQSLVALHEFFSYLAKDMAKDTSASEDEAKEFLLALLRDGQVKIGDGVVKISMSEEQEGGSYVN